jgi:7-keto-8-aminopelargonate synthetase-like enzyme
MVKRGEEVHRITVTAANTDEEVDQLIDAFAAVRERVEGASTAAVPAV